MADIPLDYQFLDSQLAPLLGARHWYVGFSGGVDSNDHRRLFFLFGLLGTAS